jgi:hypothetical protein
MNAFECLSYMSYIYMRKHHKEDSSSWEISFSQGEYQDHLGGAASDGNIPFPLMTKGERFIRCKGKCLEKEHRGMVLGGAMVTGEHE